MDLTIQLLIAVGGLLLASIVIEAIGRRTFIPRVTLLMCLGILVSKEGFDLLPPAIIGSFDMVASIALVMVGFLLGEKLTVARMRRYGKQVLWISIGASVGTSIIVALGLLAFGVPFPLAILLAGIAAATAPAATADVVKELKTDNEFAEKLLGIVALDDAWGLIVFSLCASLALIANGNNGAMEILVVAGVEIGGAIALGVALGLPAAYLTGRIESGRPTLIEALGVVFICGGLALWLEVSFLIASMTLGTVIANLAKHHERPFHEIEGIEGPFLILFFILAGASFELASLNQIGVIAAVYIACRLVGKVCGGWIGGRIGGSDKPTRRWIGLALTPQAGVALGMALIASNRFTDLKYLLLPVIISSTVFFELVGPLLTRLAIRRNRSTAL
jgi:Kef-type K+ transport system membrane component KefB